MSEIRFFPRALWNVGWRNLARHPLQSVLMILGITLGVAVVIAVDLANASASRAFDLSVDSVAGRATHQIVAGPGGLDETVYAGLRRENAVDAAAPVINVYVSSPELGDLPLQLLGIDPFAEAPFRDYLAGEDGVPLDQLTAFLTQPGAVLLSTDLAARYNVEMGDSLTLEIGGVEQEAFIAGLLAPEDGLSRRALDGLLLADIATVQELTGRIGVIDRIDLILPEDADANIAAIEAVIPTETRVLPVEARSGTVREMTGAFRVNLTALSLLALLVGLFLIYNTMTFSVVQRRSLFGTLRALGVTRREVFTLVVAEALIVGTLGSVLGIGLGLLMGQAAVGMVTQTINDLYFVLTVREVGIPPFTLIKGAVLGIVATVGAAAAPAWEAASVPPRIAMSRAGLEVKSRRVVMFTAIAGLILMASGAGTLAIPTRDLTISFAGTFAIILGAALLTPAAMATLMQAFPPITGRLWGALGRMAPRDVVNALSRTSIAVAALMVAVAVTIGVTLMVNSFRETVVVWLEQTLAGDIYVSVPGGTSTQPSLPLDSEVVETVRGWPSISRVDTLQGGVVDAPDGPVSVAAVDNTNDPNEQIYFSRDLPVEDIWPSLEDGAVLVSEPYARRIGLPKNGGQITLFTDTGPQTFPVVGIYFDYASSSGVVLMAQNTFRRYWNDDAVSALSIRLEPGAEVDVIARELEDALTPIQGVLVNPNQALRDEVLVIFDRTFAITGALQMLATVVAFVGVLSALLSLQLEKQRERGILRAVGLTRRQLWGLVMLETGLMGAAAGFLSMPTGYVLALILVYIINRRAFGWTLQLQVEPLPFATALLVAVAAALLAGIYPARRTSQMAASDAIRFE